MLLFDVNSCLHQSVVFCVVHSWCQAGLLPFAATSWVCCSQQPVLGRFILTGLERWDTRRTKLRNLSLQSVLCYKRWQVIVYVSFFGENCTFWSTLLLTFCSHVSRSIFVMTAVIYFMMLLLLLTCSVEWSNSDITVADTWYTCTVFDRYKIDA